MNQFSGVVRDDNIPPLDPDTWTHFTPNRSLNMMWFLKVLLTSKSICLISVEKERACSFIFWKEKDKETCWKSPKTSPTLHSGWHHLPSSHLVFSFVVLFDFLDVEQQSPGLASELQRDAFIHTLRQLNTHTHTRAKEPQKDTPFKTNALEKAVDLENVVFCNKL